MPEVITKQKGREVSILILLLNSMVDIIDGTFYQYSLELSMLIFAAYQLLIGAVQIYSS